MGNQAMLRHFASQAMARWREACKHLDQRTYAEACMELLRELEVDLQAAKERAGEEEALARKATR